jgi:hypothetical protein
MQQTKEVLSRELEISMVFLSPYMSDLLIMFNQS